MPSPSGFPTEASELAPFVADLKKRFPYSPWEEAVEYFYDVRDLGHLAERLDDEDDRWGLVPPPHKVRPTEEEVLISRADVVFLGQDLMRADILLHYMEMPDVLFDEQGFYDNVVPVVYQIPSGYLVLDGTHRVLAALWLGRPVKVVLAINRDELL